MGSHVYRSFAVEEARNSGWVGFGTNITREGMWKAHYERGDNPADEIAKQYPDYFTHGEVSWIPGRTNDEDPTRVGVLVSKVGLDALREIPSIDIDIDRTYARVFVVLKERFHSAVLLVEPEAGGRWSVFTPTPEGSKPTETVAPSGDRVQPQTTPRRTSTSTTAPTRSRSDGDSPVKRVWAMADAMPNASRSEVVAACVAAGINKNTAGTQYFHWKKSKSATG